MVRKYYMHFLLSVASLALLALPLGARAAASSNSYGNISQENQVAYGESNFGVDNLMGNVHNVLNDGIYGQKELKGSCPSCLQGNEIVKTENQVKPVEIAPKEEVKSEQCQGAEVQSESAKCAPQVIQPVIVKPVIKPVEVVNVVKSEVVKPVIKPIVIKKVVRPVIIKPVVVTPIIKPIVVEKVIQPVMVKTVVKQVEIPKVIKPVMVQVEVKPIIKEVCFPATSTPKYETKSGYAPTQW